MILPNLDLNASGNTNNLHARDLPMFQNLGMAKIRIFGFAATKSEWFGKAFDWEKFLGNSNSTLFWEIMFSMGMNWREFLKTLIPNEMVPQSLVTMSRTLKIMALWNLMNREG